MLNLKHGKRNPLLLSTPQIYLLSGVVFTANVAILVALLVGVSENEVALTSLARTAELSLLSEEPAERPHGGVQTTAVIDEPSSERIATQRDAAERSLRISVPDDWHWRGCRTADSASIIEILFSSTP